MQRDLAADKRNSSLTVRGEGKPSRRFLVSAILLSLTMLLFLGAGMAIAAVDAGPDSIFYPIKRALEEIHTTMSFNPADKAAIETSHASARLDEISSVIDIGKPQYIPGLLHDYDQHMKDAELYVGEAAAHGSDVKDIEAIMAATGIKHDILMIEDAGTIREVSEQELISALYRNPTLAHMAGIDATGNGSADEAGGEKTAGVDVVNGSDTGRGNPPSAVVGAGNAAQRGGANVPANQPGNGNGGYQGNAGGQSNGHGSPGGGTPAGGNAGGQSNGNGAGGGNGNAGGQGNGNTGGQVNSNNSGGQVNGQGSGNPVR